MRKFMAAMTVLVLTVMLASCEGGSSEADPEEMLNTVDALCESVIVELDTASESAVQAYAEAKDAAEAKKQKKKNSNRKKKEKQESSDDDDPANYDSTKETGKNATKSQMINKYVGTWELQGVLMADGNLDIRTGATGKYVIKKDRSYTFQGKDANGKKIDESGKWKLNGNKQLVCGDSTLGVDSSGYLLKDTGERDGKGRKIKYAFAKN